MGKKKPQKTKELTVAIAEASSTGDETKPQQSQTPRKRGRPRKIVKNPETEEGKELIQQSEAEGTDSSLKKGKTMEKEEEEEEHGRQQDETKQVGSSAPCMRLLTKEEGSSKERQLPKGQPSRSRARRKSKPRKSS
ncbi:hypothetical protein L6164_015363 [Bauhinia variegata]|uniref:Uncharacterized protein n=1 Tax=Bauhinia variegata TaxID=167791 RepID=A0ACB9NP16_BAUVA|nr:hypothetical protein L6164_015363 [Bauhinia variegata]